MSLMRHNDRKPCICVGKYGIRVEVLVVPVCHLLPIHFVALPTAHSPLTQSVRSKLRVELTV